MVKIINNKPQPEKLKLRYSDIIHFKTCPLRFKLSQTEVAVFSDSAKRNMAKGNLFEYFVTGVTTDHRDIEAIIKKNKGKFDGLSKETVRKIRMYAERTKQHIVEMHEPQLVLTYEHELFVFQSHIDFIGVIDHPEFKTPFVGIVDLKYTSSIDEIWDPKNNKDDFLQAVVYVWMVYRNTGKLLPFCYLLVQGLDDLTIVKPYLLEITMADILQFQQEYILGILNTIDFKPVVSEYNCLGVKGQTGKCRYIQSCEHGIRMLNMPKQIKYRDLS